MRRPCRSSTRLPGWPGWAMKPRWRTSLAMHRRSSTRPRPTRAVSPNTSGLSLLCRAGHRAIKVRKVLPAPPSSKSAIRNAGGQPEQISSGTQATEDAIAALAELERRAVSLGKRSGGQDRRAQGRNRGGAGCSRARPPKWHRRPWRRLLSRSTTSAAARRIGIGAGRPTGNDSDTPITVTGSVSAPLPTPGRAGSARG